MNSLTFTIKIVLFGSVFLLFFCCPEGIEKDRFLLTDDEKKLVPYLENENVKMIYSNGFEFNLTTERKTELTRTETEHCGDNYSTYELLTVKVESEIPELNIKIEVTPKDFVPYLSLSINRYSFGFDPLSEPDFESLEINGINFNNVYLLENTLVDNTVISPKEVLYNYEFGIIEITMTNNDKINLKQ